MARIWLLGTAAALLVLAPAALHFALETTTVGHAAVWYGGCVPERRAWSLGGSMPPPDASYARRVHDGETVEVTRPAGRHLMTIVSVGALVESPLPREPPGPQCPSEPRVEPLYVRGDGTMTVSYWLLD